MPENVSAHPSEEQPPADLAARVMRALGQPISGLKSLAGGLSPRRFFRATTEHGPPLIVMWLPPDAPERTLAAQRGGKLPFIEVRELLHRAGVRVPHIHGALPAEGVIVVEDLGETLAERLAARPEQRRLLYRTAVADLARAQLALRELPADSVVRTRSFDRALLSWELDHFREWGVEALGQTLSERDRRAFSSARDELVSALLELEYGFTHRDYQSRNLMVPSPDALAWIDFQDALLGPRAYDLVALLCDSYQRLELGFVTECLEAYASERRLTSGERAELEREFDLITVQRKLKDAGRFVFFQRTRGDASYSKYFVPSLELAQRALARLELSGLEPLRQLASRQIEIAAECGMLEA
jgi:hypothetical protein